MYNAMGLSASERATFEALLASHHRIDVRLTLMDLNHNTRSEVSNRLMDGQVTFDGTAAVTRSLDLELLDPQRTLHLDTNSPDNGAMFMDQMVRVHYCVVNPQNTWRVNVPIFTGPITKLQRNGPAVRVEAMGKEHLGIAAPWTLKTFSAGYRTTQAITEILSQGVGETFLNIPDLTNKLTRNVSVGTTVDKDGNRTWNGKSPWEMAKQLAAGIGYLLYYNGNGVATMRPNPDNVVFTFRDGPGGTLKSNPNAGYDIDSVINAVEVFGKKFDKETKKKQPHARVVAPSADPLSPVKLGRTGKPRYLPLTIEDDSITSDAEALDRANYELRRGLRSSIDVMYDALPVPHLEEMDVVRAYQEGRFNSIHVLKQFTIPLTAAGSSSIGYAKNVKVNRRAIKQLKRRRLKAAS